MPGGPVILLEPETWVGGRFPLLSHIDVGEALAQGRWTVVLYRQDCPACRETIGRLRQAQGQVALIEMRSAGGPGRGKFALELSFTRGVLDPTKDWFVQAPVVVELDNGVALAATVGR
ncbi:MAG: hypothetical protein U0797_00060 [Gemmataceae bacterium]